MGLRQRRAHSTASSIVFTCQIQRSAISSFASANGSSMTVRVFPEKRMRFPLLLGCSPSPASMIPAFTSSSF